MSDGNQTDDPGKAPSNQKAMSGRAKVKYRDFLISYFAQVLSASLLMMWAVMNLVHNFWAMFRANQGGNWTVTIVMVFLLGVVPFLLALMWLSKLLSIQSRK